MASEVAGSIPAPETLKGWKGSSVVERIGFLRRLGSRMKLPSLDGLVRYSGKVGGGT